MAGEPFRNTLRSISIIGGASLVNVIIGLVRIKVAAVILGPAGMGLVGLLNNVMTTAAGVTALGLGTVGTRQIAEADALGDAATLAVARRALLWGTLALALVGSSAFWISRGLIAGSVLDRPDLSVDVGWLALGVALTVVAGSQAALLNGLRRIGDLARMMVWSSLLGTLAACAALLAVGERALLAYLLLPPSAAALVGLVLVLRLPRLPESPTPFDQLARQWVTMARIGSAFMLAGLAMTAGQLAVRTLVQQQLGSHELGLFECAWLISMTYIGFVLNAMGTDYYPRLTAVSDQPQVMNDLVNQQTEVVLLLAGPIFLVMLSLAPWVIQILYSARFTDAATILRWQIIGDIFKVASWPLGYVILAAGRGRTFMICEALVVTTFVVVSWAAIGTLGRQATGLGFLAMYVVLLPLVYSWVRQRTGFRWKGRVIRTFLALLALALTLALVGTMDARLAAVVGLPVTVAFGVHGARTLVRLARQPQTGIAESRLWLRLTEIAARLQRLGRRHGD